MASICLGLNLLTFQGRDKGFYTNGNRYGITHMLCAWGYLALGIVFQNSDKLGRILLLRNNFDMSGFDNWEKYYAPILNWLRHW